MVAVIVLVLARAPGLHDEVRRSSAIITRQSNANRAVSLLVGATPSPIGDDVRLAVTMGLAHASEIRALFDRFGNPQPTSADQIDRRLVEMGVARAFSDGPASDSCSVVLSDPVEVGPTGVVPIVVYSSEPRVDVEIEVRRHGDDWVLIGTATSAERTSLILPALGDDRPWQLHAPGACRLTMRELKAGG